MWTKSELKEIIYLIIKSEVVEENLKIEIKN